MATKKQRGKKQVSNLVSYGSFDLDTLEKVEKDLAGTASSSDFLRPEPGKTVVRFLPPPAGQKSPFQIVFEHFIQPPGSGKRVRFACPKRMESARCPACERADQLRRTNNPKDREMAYDLYPSMRVYANVVDRANPEAGPKILPFGRTIYDALKSIRREDGDFTNPEADGFDIVILREGTKKMDTRYEVRPDRKDSALGNSEWITTQWDLAKYAKVDSLEEVIAKMQGSDDTPKLRTVDVSPQEPTAGLIASIAHNVSQTVEDSPGEDDDIPY